MQTGALLSDIGQCITDIAYKHDFGVIRDYSGHGVGKQFHMLPYIHHFPLHFERMQEGWIFTIEPMLTENGSVETKWDDGWTVATHDGSRCAQYEHTILITSDGAEILTPYDE